MTQRSKQLVVVCAVVALLVGAYWFFIRTPANLSLYVSPSSATVMLDGNKQITPGKLYVKPGKHTLSAHFHGFYDKSLTFTASGNMQNITLLMTPSSQAGYDWLQQHPAEQATREKIGGEAFNNSASALLNDFPIVSKLPYDGPGGEYSVGYGDESIQGGHQVLEIDITFHTDAGKQAALTWLQSQGYEMKYFTIVYIDQTYQPPVVNNPYTN